MAEKKYLDLTGLGQYDAKIKAKIAADDAATLASAKSYADGLATNYDAAGAAATALTNAKAYADAEVAKANAAAAAAQTQADKGVADAAAAAAKADAAQSDVDALETLVGELPEGTAATSVVDYVNKKTEGIATDSALAELQGQLTAAQGAIDAIEADYLVEADKTELTSAIATAKAEASDDAVDRVLGYLADEEVNVDFDTLKEVAAWIEADTTASAELVTRVTGAEGEIDTLQSEMDAVEKKADDNASAIAALQEAVGDGGSVEDMIADAVKVETDARVAADEALDAKITEAKTAASNADAKAVAAQGEVDALETVVAGKAAQSDVDALGNRVTTVEGKVTTLEGKAHTHANAEVLDGINAAKVADWDDAVAKEHEHANKEVLDGITSTLVANWNAAEANAKAYADGLVTEFTPVTSAEIDALFA